MNDVRILFPSTNRWSAQHALTLSVALLATATLSLPAMAQDYQINNLTSNSSANPAANTDPNLVNAWGIASAPGGAFWTSDTGTGLSTLYNGTTGATQALVVTVPTASGASTGGSPTGIVYGGGLGFTGGTFIFDTADGAIESWGGGATAIVRDNLSASGAIFRGLAVGANGGSNFLYAADFHNNAIDVFNTSYAATTLTGNFTDPNAVAGYAPFNIQTLTIGGTQKLFVAYAQQNAAKSIDTPGAGAGYIDEFNTDGTFAARFATGSALTGGSPSLTAINAPWGITLAPAGAGFYANDVLIGNFGNGEITAFNATTGAFQGVLDNALGTPLVQRGLWALTYGSGGAGGDANTLYFTAGPGGQTQGVFGSITGTAAAPEPSSIALIAILIPTVVGGVRMRRRTNGGKATGTKTGA